ncbi:PEP-CTERM sorting domain-containing protein [Calothrix membranacea FACHB-236]|nr:PEP-CTERM sorting domain-containing protein [Calothrix membranacea FACHB-236]
MKIHLKTLNVIAWGSLIFTAPAQAFSLDLGNWDRFGDVQIVNPSQANLSTNALLDDDFALGTDDKFNFSGNPAGLVGFVSDDLANFLGISPGLLDIDGVAYEGSAIKQTIDDVKVGDKLKFNFNFLTNETSPLASSSLIDYAFLFVNNNIIKLADIYNVNSPFTTSSFYAETGVLPYEYTFNTAGKQTIALGLVDIDDFTISSALSVSNVTLESSPTAQPVPEPTTILGTGLALGLGILSKKQSSKNKKYTK